MESCIRPSSTGTTQPFSGTSDVEAQTQQGSSSSQDPCPEDDASKRILPRGSYTVSLDKEKILKKSKDHEEYHHHDYVLRNLPEFEGCEEFVKPEKYQHLLRSEIDRLVEFAEAKSPPMFSSHNTLDGVNLQDFKKLSGLADQIWCNLAIIQHQNAGEVVKVPGVFVGEAWKELSDTRTTLRRRFVPDTLEIEGRLPIKLQDPQHNFLAYCSLLDYILGVVAWWLTRCATSPWLSENLMVALARYAVKLKLVLADPTKTAQKALDDTQGSIIGKKRQVEWEGDPYIVTFGDDKLKLDLVQEDDRDVTSLYFTEKIVVRRLVNRVLRIILKSLRSDNTPGSKDDSFELSAFVYRTGLEGVTNMLANTRHGDVLATSNLSHISFCYSDYELLSQRTAHLKEASSPPSPTSSPSSSQTSTQSTAPVVLIKHFSGRSNQNQDLPESNVKIKNMDDLVSILVPFSLLNPEAGIHADGLVAMSAMMSGTEGRISVFEPPPTDFSMEYTITSETWRRTMNQSSNQGSLDPDISPLSMSPLRRRILLNEEGQDTNTTTANRDTTQETKRILDEYDDAARQMRQWKISPAHITVNCKWYVLLVTAIALALVLGALAIPFTLGERVAGVDPFQFTLFSWACAGFIFVLGNSRYVTNWPWHDFIKRRVVCRSLSDLSDVSGIHPQLILLYLLHNEWRTILVTSGPYNGMFKRRCDPREGKAMYDDGFSINIPVSLFTMFASGFVILKVANRSGDALICIDGRKGGWDAAHQNQKGNWLTCRDFNEDYLERARNSGLEKKDLSKKILALERIEFSWDRVLGVYIQDSNFG
ncbi:hypothetical protein PG985_001469 [Apiospora marii]|uniref:Uncharacterized protein n=1 Tax=Apiospora marii TaxID=335849 RepID=A0ABR1RI31_9PEZI